MEHKRLEDLLEGLFSKRLESLDQACHGSPLSCLNENEILVLQFIESLPGDPTMGDLADKSCLAMSTLSGITDKLVSRGLISRSRDGADRRIVRVGITETGAQAISERRRAKESVCRDILSSLDDGERKLFIELLEKIVLGESVPAD